MFPLLSSALKNVLTKCFTKVYPFTNVLQNRCSYKFPDIHKKISVLESLFNKVTGLMVCNFIEKEIPTQVLSCEYHKMFGKLFYWAPLVAASENGWRISKGGLTQSDLFYVTNVNVSIAKSWQLSALNLYELIFKRSDEFYLFRFVWRDFKTQ